MLDSCSPEKFKGRLILLEEENELPLGSTLYLYQKFNAAVTLDFCFFFSIFFIFALFCASNSLNVLIVCFHGLSNSLIIAI